MTDQSESWEAEHEQKAKPKPKKIIVYPEDLEALVAAPEGKRMALGGPLAEKKPKKQLDLTQYCPVQGRSS